MVRRFTVGEVVVAGTRARGIVLVPRLDLSRGIRADVRAAFEGGGLVLSNLCSFLKYTSRVVSVIGPSGLNPCPLRRRLSSLSFINTKLAIGIDPY